MGSPIGAQPAVPDVAGDVPSDSGLDVLYMLGNEGYTSSSDGTSARRPVVGGRRRPVGWPQRLGARPAARLRGPLGR